jgi:hypothetical protein
MIIEGEDGKMINTHRTGLAQKHYRLRWEIDVWDDSPEEAAKKARELQLDFESEATFDVIEQEGKAQRQTCANNGARHSRR